MNFDESSLNEDVLEAIEIFITHNSTARNIDKTKNRLLVTQLFSFFLGMKPRPGGPVVKLSLESVFEKIDSLERKLYIHNFSYASCVREKIECKSADKEGKPKESDEATKENEEDADAEVDEENKEMGGVKIEQNGEEPEPQKEEENAGEQDSDYTFDKIVENNSDDSSKDQHTRSMEYIMASSHTLESPNNNEFVNVLPKQARGTKLFYGGHQFYICFRFYYTIFERLLKAAEMARDLPSNRLIEEMSLEDREKLIVERYETFREIFKLYLMESFEPAVYEDCLRCIFGRDAGFLFSLDKILANLTRSLPTDDVSVYVMENCKSLFNCNEEPPQASELVKYAQVSHKLRELSEQKGAKATQTSTTTNQQFNNVLRYCYDSERKCLYVNVLPALYVNWHHKGIGRAHKHFYDQMTKEERTYNVPSNQKSMNYEAVLFLNRNKRKSTLKSLNRADVRIVNRISYKVEIADQTNVNQLKLIPAVHSKEDILFRYNNKRDDLQYMRSSLKKVFEFRVGYVEKEMAFIQELSILSEF